MCIVDVVNTGCVKLVRVNIAGNHTQRAPTVGHWKTRLIRDVEYQIDYNKLSASVVIFLWDFKAQQRNVNE